MRKHIAIGIGAAAATLFSAQPTKAGLVNEFNAGILTKWQPMFTSCFTNNNDANCFANSNALNTQIYNAITRNLYLIDDVDGIIRREKNGVISIGENSLKLKEAGGRQQMWATDANGKAIDIDITNGSDLLINGRSVQGQIDENRDNINNLGQGVAASTALTSALSALPTATTDSPFSCGVGTGGYSSRFAMGIGCAAKINKRFSINAGGSHVFGGSAHYGGGSLDTIAARAGFVFKLGKIDSPAATKEQLQSKVESLEDTNARILEENAVIKAKYSTIEEQNKALMARLERLESIALGLQPATSTASLK